MEPIDSTLSPDEWIYQTYGLTDSLEVAEADARIGDRVHSERTRRLLYAATVSKPAPATTGSEGQEPETAHGDL